MNGKAPEEIFSQKFSKSNIDLCFCFKMQKVKTIFYMQNIFFKPAGVSYRITLENDWRERKRS